MKTRTSKIGLIVATIGFAIMFVGYVPMCEPNTMIQTLQTSSCEIFNLVLLFTPFFSYPLIVSGLVVLLYEWIVNLRKQNMRKNL